MRLPNERGELGRYDELCETICQMSCADAVCVVVLNGPNGSGFSVSGQSQEAISYLLDALLVHLQKIQEQKKGIPNN
jgi:hypothetical protein